MSPQPFFEDRGTPLRVRQMLRTLCAAGYEVELVSYHLGGASGVAGLRHSRAWRVPGIGSIGVGFSRAKLVLDSVLALRTWGILLARRFDVVHCVEESVFFAMPLARVLGIPVIFDLNSSLAHQLEYTGAIRSALLLRLARALQAAALRRAALAITVGRALTEEGVRSLGSATDVAEIEDCPVEDPNLRVDAKLLAALRRRYVPDSVHLAVYTGNLAAYQGLDLLFEALPLLVKRCPSAHLLIVGGEPDAIRAARQALAARGLDGHVTFTGRQPAALMPAFMALGRLLVTPRRGGRNTPLKLYSYMQSGVPVVATDLPTHTQVLDSTCAVLCAPAAGPLAEAMAAVLLDPERHRPLAAAARQRVAHRYSAAEFARKLLSAYEGVLGRSSTTSATNMYPRVHGSSTSSMATPRMSG